MTISRNTVLKLKHPIGSGLTSLFLTSLLLTSSLFHILAPCKLRAEEIEQKEPESTGPAFTTGSSDDIIQYINQQIRQGWKDNEVTPSAIATDEEWLRRIFLHIVGHIPPADTVASFLKDSDPAKRSKQIESLLADPGYVRNWTTIWTNLAMGRGNIRRVSRNGMQRFFREAFARNRPWDDIVYDLLSAEGHFEENGAVNYLLAQMQLNDDGVQATAKSTRLFLGIQVQCTQCHNHPFNDWKQNQFWEFNSFFRQLRKIEHRKYDPASGRRVDDYTELVRTDFSGPVFYEKRSGLMQVAYPKYLGEKIDTGPGVHRREELAKLVVSGEDTLIAKAFVNRMWSHFHGYGFTRPVDDMGPHNPASHPELLDRLALEFVKSRYDIKQLIRWICNSEPYNLTSQFHTKNEYDNPAAGETPLFSHMYVQAMNAEQLYDSLIIASDAHKSGRNSWDASERQRRTWMRQFIVAFGTDEADETTTFNGSIPQALMMMNGDLTNNAISGDKGSFLHTVLNSKGSDNDRIQKLFMATLSRKASREELQAAREIFVGRTDRMTAFQDLFWALINSNEFIFIH